MRHTEHTTRAQLEHAIHDAITLLDLLDGDPDFEPSLGAQGAGVALDAEADDSDLEPSLGSRNPHGPWEDQTNWGRHGSRHDAEEEHDGREPDADYEPDTDLEPDVESEPSLGSLSTLDQRRWADGAADDREAEHDGREFDGGA